MNVNAKPSERVAVVGAIHPDSYMDGDQSTGYIAMGLYGRFLAIVDIGDMDSGSTVDAKLVGYSDDAGSGAADIAGAEIATLEEADADSHALVDLNVDDLVGLGKTHFRLVVTVGAGPAKLSAIVIGFDSRYLPAAE